MEAPVNELERGGVHLPLSVVVGQALLPVALLREVVPEHALVLAAPKTLKWKKSFN